LDTIDKLKVDWTVAPEQFMGIYINEYYAFKKTMLLEGSSTRLYC
jgi:hypothetical protein